MYLNERWIGFGSRLKFAREAKKLNKTKVAELLRQSLMNCTVNRRHIEYWETLGTPAEQATLTKTRLPRPEELVAMTDIYECSGLWLFLYERDYSLTPDRDATLQHLHTRKEQPHRSELERLVVNKIRNLSEEDLRALATAVLILQSI